MLLEHNSIFFLLCTFKSNGFNLCNLKQNCVEVPILSYLIIYREFTAQDSLKLAIEFVVSLTLSILLFISLFVPANGLLNYIWKLAKTLPYIFVFSKTLPYTFLHKFSFFSLKTCQSLAINFIFLHTFSFFATRNLQKSCHKFCFFDKFF